MSASVFLWQEERQQDMVTSTKTSSKSCRFRLSSQIKSSKTKFLIVISISLGISGYPKSFPFNPLAAPVSNVGLGGPLTDGNGFASADVFEAIAALLGHRGRRISAVQIRFLDDPKVFASR